MTQPYSNPRRLPPCVAVMGRNREIALYHSGENNRCPSCGQTQWYVGRIVATCARCEAALPIVSIPTDADRAPIQAPQIEMEAV